MKLFLILALFLPVLSFANVLSFFDYLEGDKVVYCPMVNEGTALMAIDASQAVFNSNDSNNAINLTNYEFIKTSKHLHWIRIDNKEKVPCVLLDKDSARQLFE